MHSLLSVGFLVNFRNAVSTVCWFAAFNFVLFLLFTSFIVCLAILDCLSSTESLILSIWFCMYSFCSFRCMPANWYCAFSSFRAFVFVGFSSIRGSRSILVIISHWGRFYIVSISTIEGLWKTSLTCSCDQKDIACQWLWNKSYTHGWSENVTRLFCVWVFGEIIYCRLRDGNQSRVVAI